MKSRCGIILYLCVSCLFVCSAWAGGYDNRTNWSAEYIRTWNRNATTDSADGVLYNPAGMTKMDDGMYANLSLQYVDKNAVNTVDGDEMTSREPSYIPSLFALYKKDRWAAMFSVSNFGGGGSVDFQDGSWTSQQAGLGIISNANALLDANAATLALFGLTPAMVYYSSILSQQIEAESMYLGYLVGGAYKINDVFSASLGIRYVTADRKAEGSITVSAEDSLAGTVPGINDDIDMEIEYEQEATGWGAIIGFNISPNDRWNIGIRYETETQLDFEASVSEGDALLAQMGIVDGEEARRNLPAILALGVSWRMNPKIRLESNLTYYFSDNADWSGFENIDENVSNGFDLGLACMYTINDKWEASIGVLYTELGAEPEDMTPESPELEAITIGGGVGFRPTEKWLINAGIANVFYMKDSFTDETSGQEVTFEKNNLAIAVGVQYKFF
jgi:long-chain fatty acid transport protein